MPTTLQARLGALIPCYFPVDSTRWDEIINARNSLPSTPIAVVINISSGAGGSTIPAWTDLINRLRAAGVIVLGYVSTSNAADSTATVNGRTDAWKSFYPSIDGIFFDNMSNQVGNKSYYSTVGSYAKTKFVTTVGNAKTTEPTDWFAGGAGMDTIVIWDGAGLDPVDSTYSQYDSIVNNNLAVIANGIPAIDSRWVAQMSAYVGWIYITTGSGSTPYSGLPTYFAAFIQLLDDLGSGRLEGSATDQFGIRKLYHTKNGGREFFMNMSDFISTFQAGGLIQNFEGENISKQSDGSYQSNGGSEGDLRIESWSPKLSTTQATLDARWLNVEHTIYSKNINYGTSADPSPPFAFQLYSKGGHHTTSRHCEGGAYKFRISAQSSQVMFAKEACHANYSSNVATTSGHVANKFADGGWHGVKAIQYNIVEGSNTYVKLEIYVDADCSDSNGNLVIKNNWKFASSTVDRGTGGLTTESRPEDCGSCGRSNDTVLNMPLSVTDSGSANYNRNLVAYRTDKVTTRFKYWSAREIDSNKPVASAPASTGGGGAPTVDVFGVQKIFPTISGGYEWFMNMTTPNVDTTKFNTNNTNITKNADGSWKITSNNVAMYVYQRNGYNATSTANSANNHANIASRGYMQDINDWKNVEMTGYVKLNNTPGLDDFMWLARGGRHLEPVPNCEGSALRGHLSSDGSTQCVKEQFHVAYVGEPTQNAIGSIIGKWVGFKLIVVTKVLSGTTVVNWQMWLDKDNNNIWTKYDERSDSGGLGNQDGTCGGAPDQLILWGGPLVQFTWSTFTDVDFKWLSVREIDPNAVPSNAPPPPGPSTCGG